VGKVYGIAKAYCTRVGSGPFPTELHDDMGERVRKEGGEFGATTGRPRRTGWLDLPLLRYAVRLNGVTDLIITKADVLSILEEIQVCTAYETVEGQVHEVPFDLEHAKPIYEGRPGWQQDISHIRSQADMPAALQDYLHLLEDYLGVPVSYLSVGPDREQILELTKEKV
jgi:adenylosuccinate synthase